MDLLQRGGMYPVPEGASKILGVEFSGVIEELDSDVKESFKVGDEVFGLAYGGKFNHPRTPCKVPPWKVKVAWPHQDNWLRE